jgi:signal transduction histidine kinase
MFNSSGARLAAIYTSAFALATALLGVVILLTTRSALIQEFDTRIRTETASVLVDYSQGGLAGLTDEIDQRARTPGELDYGVQTASGAPVLGRLASAPALAGWSMVHRPGPGGARRLKILTTVLPNGDRLLVGDDFGRIEAVQRQVADSFLLAFAGVAILGVVGGFALNRAVRRRMSAISATAEAIIDGDLARRVPLDRSQDDIARLARTINRMLDRIGNLMDSLRQVSGDVAHDLRTPLTRLRQRLELAARRAGDAAHRAEIEGALAEVDSILNTFAAILRIAEVEAGGRRAAFEPLDLAALARTVFEDYAPAAEDAGKTLTLHAPLPCGIEGDPPLITQMLVNLLENAITHTPRGAGIALVVEARAEGVTLSVRDDGPGVPEVELERVWRRFYRLERSRSAPGSGLGLALVAAVAKLHRARARLQDARPGLEAVVVFEA